MNIVGNYSKISNSSNFMKILHVIDSLEINGGSMMCFEIASTMQSHFEVECLVVSKTGKYGRKNILANNIAQSYGLNIKSCDYQSFYESSAKYKEYIILHHRLECTRQLNFLIKPKLYMVINHTVQKLDRIRNFINADVIVSVCHYLRSRSPNTKQLHDVILNGISENVQDGREFCSFVTGRCHRFPPSKFSVDSLRFLDSLKIKNHIHFLIGPGTKEIEKYTKKPTCVRYTGKIDNQKQKKELIKSFDLYFYDTYGPEGASVAILEALSSGVPVLCKPLGGNKELVGNGINGFYYETFRDAKTILLRLYNNPEELRRLKERTIVDFRERLSIKRCVSDYIRLIEKLNK